jgi:hypothetical protein
MEGEMVFNIPQSLKAEHEELHAELAKAIQEGGQVGAAAKAVAKVLHGHFVKEEAYALPPLGLLAPLVQGRLPSETRKVLEMTEKLKASLGEMLEEHKTIVLALRDLAHAARREGKMEHAKFAEKLIQHAKTEEEIFYPVAILIGEYLKLKLGSAGSL